MRFEGMRRFQWPVAALAASVALLMLPISASAVQFLPGGGPSVRVTPNAAVEFKWITDVIWNGQVNIFDNRDGTGQPLKMIPTPAASTTQDVDVAVGAAPLLPDTTLYFQVIAQDPGDPTSLIYSPQQGSPLPSFFTGAQALSDVQVNPGTTSAQVSWEANVIGFGQVEYGQTTSFGQTVEDAQNVTDHSFTLSGLQPSTPYFFQVCNLHAIDGDCLASSTGSFTTLARFTDQFLAPLGQSTDPASPVLNTGKNGRVIPVKVQITHGATPITDLNAPGPVTIAVSGFSCATTTATDPVNSYADAGQSSAGSNQFNYDSTAQAWVYNLDTRALGLVTGNCYRIGVYVNGIQVTNAFAVFQPTK